MHKQHIKNLIASLLLVASPLHSLFFSSQVLAVEKPDFEQKIIITSQRQAGDLKNKIASYLDNVKISQGSLQITADLVQIFQQEDDHETYVAKGKPARFEQTLSDGSKLVLQADEIIYKPAIQTVTISGNALLQQAGSEVRGSKIVYNMLTEQLEAESNKNEQVKTILDPKSKAISNK